MEDVETFLLEPLRQFPLIPIEAAYYLYRIAQEAAASSKILRLLDDVELKVRK
jgi:hypothetical protein